MFTQKSINYSLTRSHWRRLMIVGILPIFSPAYGQQIPDIANINYHLAPPPENSNSGATYSTKPLGSFVAGSTTTNDTGAVIDLTTNGGAGGPIADYHATCGQHRPASADAQAD